MSEEAVRYTGAMVVEDWMIRTGLALLALNAVNGLLFWRNSVTGALEARLRQGTGIELNAALHAND